VKRKEKLPKNKCSRKCKKKDFTIKTKAQKLNKDEEDITKLEKKMVIKEEDKISHNLNQNQNKIHLQTVTLKAHKVLITKK